MKPVSTRSLTVWPTARLVRAAFVLGFPMLALSVCPIRAVSQEHESPEHDLAEYGTPAHETLAHDTPDFETPDLETPDHKL